MNLYIVHTKREDFQVYLKVSFYIQNPRLLAIMLYEKGEGPYAHLTRNIECEEYFNNINLKIEPGFAFLETNTLPWSEDFVIENKLAIPVFKNDIKISVPSGYCLYPLYKFDLEKLKEDNEKIILKYKENFNIK